MSDATSNESQFADRPDFLSTLFYTIPDTILVADETGKYLDANPSATRLLGYSREELLAMSVADIVVADSQWSESEYVRFVRDGYWEGDLKLHTRGGRVVTAEAKATRIATPGRVVFVSVIREISRRKKLEDSLRFLAEASKALSSSLDYQTTLKTVARLAVPAFADWCAIDMLTEGGELSRLVVAHPDPKNIELAHELHRRYPPDLSQPGGLGEALRSGRPQWADNITDEQLAWAAVDPYHLDLLRRLRLKSYICVPIIARGKTLGLITFVSSDPARVYHEEDVGFAEQLGQRAALAVDNALLYGDAQRALQLHRSVEERLSVLVRASDRLIGSPALEDVLPSILALSREMVDADAYAVWRLNETGTEWRIASAFGLSPLFEASVIAMTGRAPATMPGPLVAEDVYEEPLLAGRADLHRAEGIRSLLATPLAITGKLSGTLTWYYRETHRFSELEVRVATALSNMAAAAIGAAELYDEQLRMRAVAEEANHIKDEFLATVSHELRTPLNAVIGWTQILRRGNVDEASLSYALDVIERNARAQALIINDIMDVSRIITGKLHLAVRPVQLETVIAAAVDTIRPAAAARGVRIQLVLDSGAGPVSGDAGRLQQVVWNLLSNAVKFTPRHGRVLVRLERVNSSVEITVSDSGAGISAEFLPHVFDRFRQADSSTTRRHGGLGLGLAIVRHLTEAHGGSVGAHSDGEGKGATFVVRLPVTAGLVQPPHPDAAFGVEGRGLSDVALPALDGLRILLVDDEADARELLTAILAPSGAELRAVASAAEALEQVQLWRPDLIVSDIGMPDEDGYTLLLRLRALDPKAVGSTPAIALTAYARSEDRVRALAAGYQLHVPKPVQADELIFSIASLSGRTRKNGMMDDE